MIFLPFAGGSQHSFAGFSKPMADRGFQMVTPEFPGRGKRFNDPLPGYLPDLIDDVFEQVKPFLVPPYGIYGHSMGAIVGYLLTKKMAGMRVPLPVHLFFSGCQGPSAAERDPPKHLLPRDEFIGILHELGGCPEEVLRDYTLLSFFEPIMSPLMGYPAFLAGVIAAVPAVP